MFILTILEINLRNRIYIFSRKFNSIIKNDKLSRSEIELTNTQLTKLKSAAKNKIGKILKLKKKNFEDEELPHELF